MPEPVTAGSSLYLEMSGLPPPNERSEFEFSVDYPASPQPGSLHGLFSRHSG